MIRLQKQIKIYAYSVYSVCLPPFPLICLELKIEEQRDGEFKQLRKVIEGKSISI